jgi:hypothetical protein
MAAAEVCLVGNFVVNIKIRNKGQTLQSVVKRGETSLICLCTYVDQALRRRNKRPKLTHASKPKNLQKIQLFLILNLSIIEIKPPKYPIHVLYLVDKVFPYKIKSKSEDFGVGAQVKFGHFFLLRRTRTR